jgi:RNA polymerase sigma-70 factor (ECF subfamily)
LGRGDRVNTEMATWGERLARGERAAFAELYDSCADRVHHYLVVRLGSREDADEVLQNVFLRLASSRDRLADVDNLEAYVFTVARNEAMRLGSRKARRMGRERPLTGEDLFCSRPGDDARRRETAEGVAAALARLPPELREVVELKTYGGLTFHEIGQVTGVPRGTAATRYQTALARMQRWIAGEDL